MEPDAEMPESYRIWLLCKRHNTLWWSGGISNQPYIMNLEFAACEIARDIFDDQLQSYRDIIQNAK